MLLSKKTASDTCSVPVELLESLAVLVGNGNGLNTGGFCGLLHFLTVLVRTSEEEHISPIDAMVSGDHISSHTFIGVANVRLSCNMTVE